jgi:hypothetical protein
MKRYILAAGLAVVAFSTPAIAADVGVSISIGQPGFFGRIDLGDFPQPQVIYAQPRIIEQVQDSRPPIYLRVPPGHVKHWRKHCREYNACGERVFFVQDNWYNQEYIPRYQKQHGDRGEGRRDENRGERRKEHHEKQGDERQGEQRGPQGEGHGHGRDH